MSYPYGTKGMPALGHAPGLPNRQPGKVNADTTGFPAQYQFIRASAVLIIPGWTTYFRISATGNGGQGAQNGGTNAGGGGGGFAGTNIEKAQPGTAIAVRLDATGFIVDCPGYHLVAGHGGNGGANAGGAGGVGSGGAVNFSGGNGGGASGSAGSGTSGGSGGSAASRAGPGNAGTTGSIGTTGGAGTAGLGYFTGSAPGGAANPTNAVLVPPASPNAPANNPTFGLPVLQVGGAAIGSSGGDGGGGSGGTAISSTYPAVPGSGFVLVEFW